MAQARRRHEHMMQGGASMGACIGGGEAVQQAVRPIMCMGGGCGCPACAMCAPWTTTTCTLMHPMHGPPLFLCMQTAPGGFTLPPPMQHANAPPMHTEDGPTLPLTAHLYPHADLLQLDAIELLREAPHCLVTAGADLLHDGRYLRANSDVPRQPMVEQWAAATGHLPFRG